MRLLRAFFVALLTAVVGCVLALFVGDYLTRLADVPEMEGQWGMTVIFLCVPLGILAIPRNVPLLTHSNARSLLASIGNEPGGSQFIELKIPRAPTKQDETWSEWIFATQRADLSPVPEPERFAARYRVRTAD